MPDDKKPKSAAKVPLQPQDFFSKYDAVPNTFGNVTTKETTGQLSSFNPKEYSYITNPKAQDDREVLSNVNAAQQPYTKQIENSLQQFGANFTSGFGQGLANLLDVSSWGNDNYQSSLFGVSTKDMQDWANGVAQRNKILRENPNSFSPGDFGWWMEQVASSGTGVGMAGFALLETMAIEAATGGAGIGVVANRLGKLFKGIKNSEGAVGAAESFNAIKDLRSAATTYGVLSRTNESRMEAMQSYQEISDELASQQNPDGTAKYSEAQIKEYAAKGASRTFYGNMALLPLDILSYRTMVFNPISGAGTNMLEKGLQGIGNRYIRKAVQGTVFSGLEGTEEGFQYIAQQEGKHYAKVLGGMDDNTNFGERVAKAVTEDEFWNNFAGGVIGSPIIGGMMHLTNKVISGNRAAKLNSVHSDYVQNIAKMDDTIAKQIVSLQAEGKTKEADVLRRQYRASKALSALHLDAMTDKNTAFESHLNFLEATLEEVNKGNLSSLQDLGFSEPTDEQVDYIKNNFQKSIDDAKELKTIYDNVKDKYNKNFVPQIAQSHFQVNRLLEAQQENNADIVKMQNNLYQFGLLSPNGKQQYNAEYELSSLLHEQKRLTEEFRNTKNEDEKENINHVLGQIKFKVSEIKTKLDEIAKDDTYTDEQKNIDNDILQSALRDNGYAQAMYDKEHISNAIAIERKNLTLWNKPEYVKQKTKESIAKARTTTQVDNNKTDTTDEDIQREVDNKNSEVAAKEAAEALRQQQANSSAPTGNANLFEEDNELINNITGAVSPTEGNNNTNPDNDSKNPEYLFLPADYNFEQSSQEAKDKIISGVGGLISKLGDNISFEDLVRHIAKVQGVTVADNIYNALKWGWEKNGKPAEDYQAIYNKIFNNPLEQLISGVQELSINTPAELNQATNTVTNKIVAEQEGKKEFDNNNQPIYEYKGVITNESSPKMAFSTRLSQLIQTLNEDGTIAVSHEYTEDELNEGDYTDSLQLLDPDSFIEGTELEIRVPTNFNEIKIPVYNADGSKGKSMTFGAYVAENNLNPDSKEYQDKLPMIIYKKGAKVGEKGVSFVHDIGWYHPLRFNQMFENDMKQAIANTQEIRKEVLESTSNSVPIIITGKRQTTFAGLKTKNGQTISLKEANPETELTVALSSDSLSTSKKNKVFPNNETSLINNTPFRVGAIYEVRRYGRKDGVKTFVALPVLRPKLDEASKTTVLQAINIYANRANADTAVRDKHSIVVEHIKNTMGLDILSESGIQKYLKHFVTIFNTEKAKTNADVEAQAKAALPEGTPYIAFIAGGNIVFGQANTPAYVSNGKKVFSFFINPNSPGTAGISLNALTKPIIVRETVDGVDKRTTYPDRVSWYEHNLNLDNLNENKPVVVISRDLVPSIAATSYKDFLLTKLQTNIRSHNIGTAEKPNWVTNVQPVITYESKSKLQQSVKSNEEVVAEIVEDKVAIPTEVQSEELSELEKKIIAQAKKDLGSDFGISRDNPELFSPEVLSDEQRELVTSDINRIAGLTPDQQFDITDFMYNQITSVVNLETKQVTKAEVNAQVDKSFKEVIEPLKVDLQTKVKELEDLLALKPQLQNSSIPDIIADYKYRISKIDDIKKNIKVLKEEAYNRVAKYTGITENRIETEKLNDESHTEEDTDLTIEDNANAKERDFWTDVLQENPESRLSYTMRRFFGQIRKYDKQGNPMTGFLGLPTYTGADIVTRNLMVLLADVPSDFDIMIAKLETMKESIPWMQEAIDKLKGASQQSKNQFVTVMSNTSLRMKFTMISFNRKTNSWSTKVWNTHLNGIADSVMREWKSNLLDSDLVIANDEGNYEVNKERAKYLINKFEGWRGSNLKVLEGDKTTLESVRQDVKLSKPVVFIPGDKGILQFLKTNLVKNSDRIKVSMKGSNYQITNVGNGKFKMEFLSEAAIANNEEGKSEVDTWLKNFGINLSKKTIDELFRDGLSHNYTHNSFNALFYDGENTNGLFGILYNRLKHLVEKEENILDEDGSSPLQDSVITSLANLESKYNETNVPFGFRDNGKSFFALSIPKFITDRARDLKSPNSDIREQLSNISFSKSSLWLMLLGNEEFKNKFGVAHIGANAFKEQGKKLYRDNGINTLSEIDHELTKLGMFWDMTQGLVSYNTKDKDNRDITLKTYPSTSINMRVGTMFSPTMSDKHMMTLVTTAVLNLESKDLLDGKGITDEVAKVLYEQTVKPELLRMIKFHQNGSKTNISAYDNGAGMFLLMPEMNNIEYSPGLKLIDAIRHNPNDFTQDVVESNEELMKTINDTIKQYIATLTEEKMKVWEDSGFLLRSGDMEVKNDGELTEKTIEQLKFFDKKYLDKFSGKSNEEKARMSAMDFIINSMVANANSFMTMAGDPAMYFKSKSNDYLTIAKDTFVNAGKRLANQIAPGTALSNSENEKYIQIFLKDRISVAENIEYIEKLIGKERAESYRNIEASDAQEYTTWKEHLDILSKLGKTPDTIIDITPEEISEARELFSSGVSKAKLTEKQSQLLGKVMQPIKPVYTGQIYDAEQDVMRTMYIKSSSFPLIPQLTAGMEIDKLRIAMEKIESSRKMNVRASYQSANKVGSVNNPSDIWNSEGNINEDALKNLDASTLILDRKNFRIQQEVPFKSGKQGEDKISLGTQLMKLLFGDEIMKYDGFMLDDKSYTGKELHTIYNNTFIELVKEKKNQLFNELGLDENGYPVDDKKSMQKLQSILKEEAIKRGYPLQDIKGLTLNADGQFNLPLWASSNSNRYESMLNAIVSNRLIRMKFPGNSFVVGSEEGFVKQDNLEGVDKSKIIYTSAWNGKNLVGTTHENGMMKKAQVLIGSKFKDANGNLIDLFTKEGSEYKYITKTDTGYILKEDMFDKDLLSMLSFRIPTSGHQSASQIEIVGFLPFENADLMIVPKNFTKQKGLDFDVDKENAYQLWSHINENGKLEVLQEKHRTELLAKADRELQKVLKSEDAGDRMLAKIFGEDGDYTDEDLADNKFLGKLNSKITEKLMQNQIIKINHAVYGNDNPEIQSKIAKTLNTDFEETQAEFIDTLASTGDNTKYWTPLSDEYQKQKMIMGASGKIGTGAYSLDVVFHSLVQQASVNNKGLYLTEVTGEGEERVIENKTYRFGNIESDGTLGRAMTLDGARTIAEVMSGRQNIAVDNEKLQVMGRVNLNDITMDVDKVMNLLGFDKGEDGNSISFLFLSQPIIKEFVKRMKNSNSNVSDFEADRESRIFTELLTEYDLETIEEEDDQYWQIMSSQMTNKNFITALKADVPDGALQGAVLRRFMDMRNYGLAIRNIQTTINTDSKGLGKSFFDVIEKRNALNKLGGGNSLVSGASGLIGDYIAKEDISGENVDMWISQGYIDIGNFLVKPSTLSGGFNIYGVSTAYNLWNNHFPYDSTMVEKVFNEIVPIISSGNVSDSRLVEYKQRIFQGIKKYSAASTRSGIISASDDINEERKRLFIDSETNTSLAKYIKSLLNIVGNPVVDRFIKRNNLINRFEFDIQKNGQPSLIKFNNAAGEEFDEQYLYESLSTLIEKRGKDGSVKLPKIGNKEYTLDTLAQDLIAYSYLGNAVQEAIQFTKYVPVAYLNAVGYSNLMRQANDWFRTNPNILRIRNTQDVVPSELKHLVSEFTMQYVQHNPERVGYKLDNKNFNKRTIKIDDNSFKLVGEDKPTFISVYDSAIPKGEKKFRLYWFDGDKYTKIPTLGTFGMDEYQPGHDAGISLVNGRVRTTTNLQGLVREDNPAQEESSLFNIDSNNITTIVNSIIKNNTTKYTEMAKALAPYISEELKIQSADSVLVNGKVHTGFMGHYNRGTRIITINTSIKGDADKLANTILHELVHDLTTRAIQPHIDVAEDNTVSVKADAPAYVTSLVRLFNNLKSGVEEGKIAELKNRLKSGLPLGEELKSNYYGYTNVYEFMSMALTDTGFQEILNGIPFKDTGKTFLERFKEIVQSILESIGIKFDKNFSAAQAISIIFEVIDKSNFKANENPYQQMFDETMNGNEDTSFLDKLDDEMQSGEPDVQLSPSTDEQILEQARLAIIKSLPESMQAPYLNNIVEGLREIAVQVNSGNNEMTVKELYGKELTEIAMRMFPNEKYNSKNVSGYINTLNSDEINC